MREDIAHSESMTGRPARHAAPPEPDLLPPLPPLPVWQESRRAPRHNYRTLDNEMCRKMKACGSKKIKKIPRLF
ncbi:MAG: hypothetical protein F4Y18_03495 [Cenarchaeum sp. SB0663_bin_5]|nr:hypothetical protein [Cenarchaeum sp. SB0663_bin_5]